jgi:hypothetical protein
MFTTLKDSFIKYMNGNGTDESGTKDTSSAILGGDGSSAYFTQKGAVFAHRMYATGGIVDYTGPA